MLEAKDLDLLPDKNLSQVSRELSIDVLLSVSKLQVADKAVIMY
jgi:hypothetical protein